MKTYTCVKAFPAASTPANVSFRFSPVPSTFADWLRGGGPGSYVDFARLSCQLPIQGSLCAKLSVSGRVLKAIPRSATPVRNVAVRRSNDPSPADSAQYTHPKSQAECRTWVDAVEKGFWPPEKAILIQ